MAITATVVIATQEPQEQELRIDWSTDYDPGVYFDLTVGEDGEFVGVDRAGCEWFGMTAQECADRISAANAVMIKHKLATTGKAQRKPVTVEDWQEADRMHQDYLDDQAMYADLRRGM